MTESIEVCPSLFLISFSFSWVGLRILIKAVSASGILPIPPKFDIFLYFVKLSGCSLLPNFV